MAPFIINAADALHCLDLLVYSWGFFAFGVALGMISAATGIYFLRLAPLLFALRMTGMEKGRIILATGRIILSIGKTILPTGRTILPTGQTLLPTGRTILPTGKIILPIGNNFLATGKISGPSAT